MKFSERNGYAESRFTQQKEAIDKPLLNVLWNSVHAYLFEYSAPSQYHAREGSLWLIATLAQENYFEEPIDELPEVFAHYRDFIKEYMFNHNWYEVYDFIEWLGQWGKVHKTWKAGNPSFERAAQFRQEVNQRLEQKQSAYRFVGEYICEIIDQNEIDEVSYALNHSAKYRAAAEHINAAVELYSDRKHPDFRNSIKESISAVESVAKIIAGSPTATLGEALKKLETSHDIHDALKKGFSKLYGWTCTAEGIRHAMLEMHNLTLADARYMLVTCSAFVNYLISKSDDT